MKQDAYVAPLQQSTERHHRPVCRVECVGLFVRLHILALREMIYAQDLAAAAPILIALALAPTSSRADNVGAVFGVLI
jgi:hypothetical protein